MALVDGNKISLGDFAWNYKWKFTVDDGMELLVNVGFAQELSIMCKSNE